MARVRIKDIAQEAGVSPATVSRYLNNTPGAMTDETRARIAEVVERTGYRPLAAARSLRTDRSHLLGIVLADIVNPYSSAMIEALSTEAAKVGYTLMTAVSSNDAAAEASAIERLCAAGADALVVNTCGGNEHLLRTTNTRVPVVLLDRDCTGGGLDLVTSNNSELMDALVDELCGCGCERLVLLTEQDRTSSVRREREGRFLDRAAERGVAGQLVELSADSNKAAVQVKGAIAGSEKDAADAAGRGAVGLIAVNGLVFFRLIEAFQDSQLREQWGQGASVAAAGAAAATGRKGAPLFAATFDDYAWNRMFQGGVTTAAQDVEAIAAAVMERVVARIEDPALKPQRVQIPGRIVRRASTGA